MSLGGSTKCGIAFVAMAKSVNVDLTIDDFQK